MGINKVSEGKYGSYIYNAQDTYIGKAIEEYGEWAEDELDLLKGFLKPGDTVLDIGANIGTHTVAFATFVGPSGQVISFEPQRLVYQCLCANIALNSLMNVIAFQMGVGRQPGVLQLPPLDYMRPQNFGGVGLSAEETGETVNITSLANYNPGQCALIKIDVEGMELDVLQGAAPLISAYRPVLYVENNIPERSEPLVAYLQTLGYHLYWHLSPYFNPENFNGSTKDIFGNTFDRNLLCVTEPIASNAKLFPVETSG